MKIDAAARIVALVALSVGGCAGDGQSPGGEGDGDDGAGTGGDHGDDGADDDGSGGADDGADGEPDDPDPECGPLPELTPLYGGSPEGPPVVEVGDDGVIVTHAAGRVRQRHELEGTYNTFGERYFENRSFEFVVEDHVAAGESRIVITYRPEADVTTYGPGTNLRVWKVYGDGNVFHDNRGLDQIDLRHLEATIENNRREGRELAVGDVMEFEFGVFIAGFDEADPDGIEGRTSYYTDTFRYQVGVGGLSATNRDPSGTLGPDAEFFPGGDTTVPYIYAEPDFYFSQMALNVQPEHVQKFLRGRRLFHTDFGTGEHSEGGNPVFQDHVDQVGPLFNVASCSTCHVHNGRGVVEAVGEPLMRTVIKLYDGGELGRQLQPQEGEVTRDAYEASTVTLGDGTELDRQRPVYAGLDPSLAPSVRLARRLVGMGLLEAIDDETILSHAVGPECDTGDTPTGRASVVTDPLTGEPRLGRFGWKAEKVSVRHQIADALDQDMGVTTTMMGEGAIELEDDELEQLETYMRLLAVPPRRTPDDPQVTAGGELFTSLGCVQCHRPELVTGESHPFAELRGQAITPYTDLLLHDMGDDLADPGDDDLARQWRTPPLWGLGLVLDVVGELQLLHDGRARSVLEAVSWHGGEATAAREAFLALSEDERAALQAFVLSL